MGYIIETKLPQPDLDNGEWYPIIDVEASKVLPQVLKFETKEQAEKYAEKHSVNGHSWRVVEDEVQ